MTGITLDQAERRAVEHIIASHHGPWGTVQPRTPEAALVHYCDLYSAKYHRQPPVDANDILRLMDRGMSRAAAARALGVTSQVVSRRLEEARHAEWLDGDGELLALWRSRGHVVAGSEKALAHREEIRLRVLLRRKKCRRHSLPTEPGGSGETVPSYDASDFVRPENTLDIAVLEAGDILMVANPTDMTLIRYAVFWSHVGLVTERGDVIDAVREPRGEYGDQTEFYQVHRSSIGRLI